MIFHKLSTKLSFLFILLTLVLLIAISVFAFHFTQAALQELLMKNQLKVAQQGMGTLDRLLYERLLDIQAIAGEKAIEKMILNRETAEAFDKEGTKRIQELTVVTGPWDILMITDYNGHIILSSEERQIGNLIQDKTQNRLAFQKALREERVYYSDYFVSELLGQPTIIFSAPIHDSTVPKQPVIGTVVGHLSWGAVTQILEDMNIEAALLNAEGQIIGKNLIFEEEHTQTLQFNDPEFILKFKQEHSFSLIMTSPDEKEPEVFSLSRQKGYLNFEGNRWGLLVEEPMDQAFASAHRTALKLVLFLIPIILFSSIPVLFIIFGWINRPIAKLTETTHEIAAGNLSKKVSVNSEDEIGQLATSFNLMTEKLRQSKENLEKQVRERTAELMKSNEALHQSEKMSAVGQLAAGVAHEINNPLGVILGFAQGMARRVALGDPHETAIKSIEREAMRCKKLVHDLLVFSRSGKAEKEKVHLNQVIDTSLTLVESRAKVHNVELDRHFDNALPDILANTNQIQQVIVNLCNNAIDAMPHGGKIQIHTAKRNFQVNGGVEIAVSDSGEGMSAEIQAKIFNPFFTTKPVGKGTGLGLSLVYEIVKKHDGEITVESQIGKGTTFHILLPLAA